MALNILLELLVLPLLLMCLGRCPYKLALDECVPSPHPLSVIESFVNVIESQRSFRHQPTELLDAIVGHVGPTQDLFVLALSHRSMYGIVFLRRIEYRVIRNEVNSSGA